MRGSMGLVLGAALAAMIGCGDDDEGVERRGSAACQDFQDAICDFGADRCSQIARADCDRAFAGVECASDELASSCANGLNMATCGVAVNDCDLSRIIDRAPASSACDQLVGRICKRFMDCGQIPSLDACQAAIGMVGLDCSQAFGVSPDLDTCFEQVDALKCPLMTLPTPCRGVITVVPPGVFGTGAAMTTTP